MLFLFHLTVKPTKIPELTRENSQGFPTSRDISVDFCIEAEDRARSLLAVLTSQTSPE